MDFMISNDIQELSREYPEYVLAVRRNYWWNFTALILDSSIFSFAVAMLSVETILPYFVSHLSNQSFWVGVVPALYFLGEFFPQLFGAYLVHHMTTRKWPIVWIAVSERIGILAIALVAQFVDKISSGLALGLFLLSYTLFTITNGLIAPAYNDYISKNIVQHRGLFFGVREFGSGLIGLVASLTASSLLLGYTFPVNLRILFWIGFATSFISPFIEAALREIPYPVKKAEEKLGTFFKDIPSLVKKQVGMQKFLIARGVFGVCLLANSFFAIYAVRRFSLDVGVLGIFTMIILLTRSAFGFIWGYLGDHFGYKKNYIYSSVVLIGMGILALTSNGVWGFYIIAFGIGAVNSVIMTSDPNMIFQLSPPNETSRFVGIVNTIISPVMTFAPIVGGLLVDNFSYPALFIVQFTLSIIALVCIWRLMPDARKMVLHLSEPKTNS
jgi:MFS family permease